MRHLSNFLRRHHRLQGDVSLSTIFMIRIQNTTEGASNRDEMSLSLIFLLGLHIFPQVFARFWCDKNFGWRMEGEKPINDCDLLQDRLTLYLDRLVTVAECVRTVSLQIEGFWQKLSIGGSGNVQSIENPVRNPLENALVNRCKPVLVEVEVEILSGEKRISHFMLNPMNCFDKDKQLTFAEGEGHEIQIDLNEQGLFKTETLWETCLTSITIEDLEGENLAYDYLLGEGRVVELMVDRCVEQRLTVVYMFREGRQEKLVRVPRKTKTVYVRGIPTAVDDCQADACEVGWQGDLHLVRVVDDFDVFSTSFPLHWTLLVKAPTCVDSVEVFGSDGRLLLDVNPLQLTETKELIWVENSNFRNPCFPAGNELMVNVNKKHIWRKTLDPIGEWLKTGELEYVRRGASSGTLAWIHPKLTR